MNFRLAAAVAAALTWAFLLKSSPAGAQYYPSDPPAAAPGAYGAPAGSGAYDTSYGGPPQGYTVPGSFAGRQGAQPAASTARVGQWFQQYDQIRRRAQMNPRERQQADYFLSKITAVFVPGQEKMQARQLLTSMVNRYRQATQSLKQLPLIPETGELQRGYYRYFVTAGNLFIDYLKVQDNLLAPDQNTGQPIAAGLMQRKQDLEALNQSIQSLDQQLRERYGIAPYQYQ